MIVIKKNKTNSEDKKERKRNIEQWIEPQMTKLTLYIDKQIVKNAKNN